MSCRGEQPPISGSRKEGGDADGGPPRVRLLEEVRLRLRVKHYSLRTEKAYLYWIRRYIHANGRRYPRELDGAAVERFPSRLATDDHVAPSTRNQALSALLFLDRDVLGIRLPWMENVVRAKGRRRLPVVLSKSVRDALCLQIEAARLRHAQDPEAGFGEVRLPHALARKHPNAPRLTAWQSSAPCRICRGTRA